MDKPPLLCASVADPPDSGIVALVLFARLSGIAADAAELRHRFGESGSACTPERLLQAARGLGLRARLRTLADAELDALPLPQLIALDDGSWAILARLDAERALLQVGGEPAPRIVARAELARMRSGPVLLAAARAGILPESRFGIGWIAAAARPYRGLLLEVLLASAVVQLLGLAAPLFFQVVVDKVLVNSTTGTLAVLVTGLLLVSVFEVVLTGLRAWLLAHTTHRMDVLLGARLFGHLLALPLRWFEARRAGDIVARVRELETLRAFVTGSALTLVIDLGFTLIAFALMAWLSPLLAAVVACSLPAYALIGLFSLPLLRARLELRFRLGAESQSMLVETLGGIHTLKALALEVRTRRRWEDRLAAQVRASLDCANAATACAQAASLVNRLVAAALLWFGAQAVMAGVLTVGQLVACNLFAQRIGSPVMRLFQVWLDFQQARVSLGRLGELMHAPAEGTGRGVLGALPSVRGAIRFERVTFRYQQERAPALAEFDLQIAPGEIVGLVGASGSGKSTLARLLQRLYVPEQGRVLVDGHDIALIEPESLRRQIGVVPQDVFLFNASVRENIALGDPGMPLERIVRAALLAGADEFIRELPLGYDTPLGEHARVLSGGQRQRLAIARALVRDPPILVFDEATSALDYEAELAIRNNLGAICARRTVIIIAHRIATLAACQRIVVLERGRVLEQGSERELLERGGFFARLHALQHPLRAA